MYNIEALTCSVSLFKARWRLGHVIKHVHTRLPSSSLRERNVLDKETCHSPENYQKGTKLQSYFML